ncbi:MAG: AAA family ATPase [Ardenticatenales bacterium]|nr:AAA family ATPase [Ardenticatenales bacterium]
MSPVAELSPADLTRVCDDSRFPFETTAELPFSKKIIGQGRGTRAIEFGIGISSPGFNIYVLGMGGTGRTTTIERFLQEEAAAGPVPHDWVYVQNFQDLRRPRAIRLPPGEGARFRDAMSVLVDDLMRQVPKAFETEEYKDALASITQELEAQRNRVLQEVRDRAAEQGFAIIRMPHGLIISPLQDGKPMELEAYQALSAEQQAALDTARQSLERNLDDALGTVADLEQRARDEIDVLDRGVASSVADHLVEPLKEKWAAEEEAVLHLNLVRDDIIAHVEDFRPGEGNKSAKQDPFRRYVVNLIVDHGETTGAPVIVESNPTYHNLIGRIEYEVRHGVPTTDFTNIKAGALHRGNGGYLVLRASDLLDDPDSWQALKRALLDGQIRIEEMATGSIAAKTLDPEPVPLNAKIILLGSATLYYMLFALDEDFPKLFKVKADFDSDMDRTPENEEEVALFVAGRCHDEDLRHFDRRSVGRIVEYSSRLAGRQDRLATRFGELADVVREASYWAGEAGREIVNAADVDSAIRERVLRANLPEEQLRRLVRDGMLFIDTSGMVVGQLNGLAVIQIGDHSFGQPSRVTARTYMGDDGVVSIEREVKLAGPIHDRGVLTLIGYLGGRYAQSHPLSLSATLAFEQNYTGVDGDSASSTELYALLSSLSDLPIHQGIAVTGSVDQWGNIQPIGGATEKIEGFFDVCAARGLTGDQGVIMPAANKRDLVLRDDVVQAVASGQFHVWAVETIDEGLELLTGVPAGEPTPDGVQLDAEGSVHGAVQARLRQLAVELESFARERCETQD